MSMRTPLSRARGLGSAKTGTEHWWLQRVTAISNLPLVLFMIGFVVAHLGASRAELVASVHHPIIAILLAAAFLSVLWHMRLGMQVIIEDYVHKPALKLSLVLFNTFFTLILGVAALYAIITMALGA
jgi:succinate dehydrogenase / fumarate reductase membrane anchor subunit